MLRHDEKNGQVCAVDCWLSPQMKEHNNKKSAQDIEIAECRRKYMK
jgi:hypothetical protein